MAVAPPRGDPRRRVIAIGSGWREDVELPLDLLQAEAYLRSCHDFLVDDAEGREVGVVGDVEVEPGTGRVVALEVCGGWFGRRRSRIPVEEVLAIYPQNRRIVVKQPKRDAR